MCSSSCLRIVICTYLYWHFVDWTWLFIWFIGKKSINNKSIDNKKDSIIFIPNFLFNQSKNPIQKSNLKSGKQFHLFKQQNLFLPFYLLISIKILMLFISCVKDIFSHLNLLSSTLKSYQLNCHHRFRHHFYHCFHHKKSH